MLAQDALAGANFVVENGTRSDKGFVLKADVGNAELRVVAKRSVVSGLREFDAMRGGESVFRPASQVHDAQVGKSPLALQPNEMVLESFRCCEHDYRTIRNNFTPEIAGGIADRGDGKAKCSSAGVCSNEENLSAGAEYGPRMVVLVILVMVVARRDELEPLEWGVGAQERTSLAVWLAKVSRRYSPLRVRSTST